MPLRTFEWLLVLVKPLIQRQNTVMRTSISAHDRLYITLRFLASGDSYRSLEMYFLIGESTIGWFVPKVCQAIYDVLKDDYLKQYSSTPDEWRQVADLFQHRWQVPNCLGALDGKHIQLQPPINSGSYSYNYKHYHSVVLMALFDANYRFLYIDIGANGRISDRGVFAGTTLQKALQRGLSMFPKPAPCPGDERPLGFYIVADDAFPMSENLMKPFSYREMVYDKRIFNYQLSRGRRVVENAFGILANRWCIFLQRIPLQPSTVEKVVLASVTLHNMLRDTMGFVSGIIDKETRGGNLRRGACRLDRELEQASLPTGTNVTQHARAHHEYLVRYFQSEAGSVPWQNKALLQ